MKPGAFSPSTRAAILDRSAGTCELCGLRRGEEVHHRRPRAMGGTRRPATSTASNALHLCGGCHRHVESDRERAYTSGWLVRQNRDPRSVPVLYRGHSVLLDDAGTPP